MQDPEKKLTHRRYLFCLEYVKNNYNGTQAAITAGYAEANAGQEAERLLNFVEVQQAISEIERDRMVAVKLTSENILEDVVKTRNAAYEAKQYGVSARCDELLGKILLNTNNRGLKSISSNPDGTVKIEFTSEDDKV